MIRSTHVPDAPHRPAGSRVLLVSTCIAATISALMSAGCSTAPDGQFTVVLPDYCPTPDSMAVAPEGDLVVACPNYGSYPEKATTPSQPACFIRVSKAGKVTNNATFARTNLDYSLDPNAEGFLEQATKAKMRTTDGICFDDRDNLYVADFSNNAITRVTPDGHISVPAQNGDTDGTGGLLDQPGEPVVWNGRLVVTCFDMVTGPDKVNTGHDKPHTITSVRLK